MTDDDWGASALMQACAEERLAETSETQADSRARIIERIASSPDEFHHVVVSLATSIANSLLSDDDPEISTDEYVKSLWAGIAIGVAIGVRSEQVLQRREAPLTPPTE